MAAAENGSPNTRVSFSIDTLRTEIRLANAELEIRLMKELAENLAKQATKEETDRIGREVETLKAEVDTLGTDKAGRDAVQNARRYFIGGGILTTVLMFCQLALTFYIVTQQNPQ